jgi:hypothetical protein
VESIQVPELWLEGKNIPTAMISLDPKDLTDEQMKVSTITGALLYFGDNY